MVTMEEIDALREVNALRQKAIHECALTQRGYMCRNCEQIRDTIVATQAKIDAMLREWWAQGCREVDDVRDLFRAVVPPSIRAVLPANWPLDKTNGTNGPPRPGDVLAAAVRGVIDLTPGPGFGAAVRSRLGSALDDYTSTRNAGTLPESLTTVGLPDEKKIAIFLLDTMTGGALSSLLCSIRDTITDVGGIVYSDPPISRVTLDNLKSNLKALGF